MIVVDTSVLVDFLRGRETSAVERLEWLERERIRFAIPQVCCQELLQGAKDEGEWQILLDYLETQVRLAPEDPWRTHVSAARLYFDCRRRGLTVLSSVDCLVAQLTLEVDGTLLHDDEDFERLREVSALRTLR